jgi:hypothetical protein
VQYNLAAGTCRVTALGISSPEEASQARTMFVRYVGGLARLWRSSWAWPARSASRRPHRDDGGHSALRRDRGFFAWLFAAGNWTPEERRRLVVVVVLLGATAFWAVFNRPDLRSTSSPIAARPTTRSGSTHQLVPVGQFLFIICSPRSSPGCLSWEPESIEPGQVLLGSSSRRLAYLGWRVRPRRAASR